MGVTDFTRTSAGKHAVTRGNEGKASIREWGGRDRTKGKSPEEGKEWYRVLKKTEAERKPPHDPPKMRELSPQKRKLRLLCGDAPDNGRKPLSHGILSAY